MKRLLAILLLLSFALPLSAMDVKPLAYSLLMPGMGEYSLGYKTRAYAHWAVEAGGWYGVVHYRNVGFDRRYEYEAYADVHWSEGRWRSAWSEDWLDHEDAWDELCASAVAFDESHITSDDDGNEVHYLDTHFAPYAEDPQHYYENLGNYDSSDDAFDTAHNILTAMLLARVVSLVDTYIILVRLDHGSSDQAIRDGWRMSYQIEDRGGFRLGMTRNW